MSERVGHTTGVFDMFHIGHLNLLRRARAQCDRLVVGVTTDERCLERKHRLPIIGADERMQIVQSIRYVDYVVPQGPGTKFDRWRLEHFDVMFVGDDWRGSAEWEGLELEFGAVGVEIVYLPYTTHTSSTILRQVLDERLHASGW